MVKVAVVYHSGYGHTKKQAEAVVSGVSSAGATVQLIPVADIDMHWEYLAQARCDNLRCSDLYGQFVCRV